MPDSAKDHLTDEEIEEADMLSTDALVAKMESGHPAMLANGPSLRISQGRIDSGNNGIQLVATEVTISGSHIAIVGVAVQR
jgi:hypothetical protein